MKEFLTREDAVKLCNSHQHLIRKKFTVKNGMEYNVNFIVPVPANKEEMDEFRDLVAEYIQTGNRTKLFEFDIRNRPDEFIPVLFGRVDLKEGANLLCVPLRSFVDSKGHVKQGYEVSPGYWLF